MKFHCLVDPSYSLVLILTLLFSLTPSFPQYAGAVDIAKENWGTNQNAPIEPIIHHSNAIDRDFNGIQDSLETLISQSNASASLPIIVTLYNPVKSQDLDWFATLGGHVTQVYRYVTYGFAGVIPSTNITTFAGVENENLCAIEYDAPLQYHLDVTVPLIRVRPLVWDTYGYTGSPNQSIAIIDTGIDDTHSDVGPYGDLNFSRKTVGWYDATPDMAATPEDYGEHGTHCAAIAAGTGDANPLITLGFATNTWTYTLSDLLPGYGYIHYGFDVMNQGLITITCMWTSGNSVFVQLRDVTGSIILNQTSGYGKPLVLTYHATAAGRYRPVVGVSGGGMGTGYFSLRETYPYQGRSDGYNLFTGVAPTSKLVGVKVFDNAGSGYTSTIYGGMDWVIANKHAYNITVASMSLSLVDGDVDTTFDQKADTMVENGIVLCVSAGNNYPDYTIGSPGTAAYAITVAATNDENGITSYSSNGDPNKNEYGLTKPDVAAPGGSTGAGNLVISADSNDVDYEYSGQSDYTSNDYQQFSGTSMSTPHVAGLAALIIDALPSWSWTKDEAFKVKMILSMTSFETDSGEGSNVPLLDRGEKDNVEGYGRISADAAIEASTMTYSIGDLISDTFGSAPSDKKVWARQVSMLAGNAYSFNLSVPAGADYDLYLYSGTPDDYGQPVILEKSVNSSVGADETITYTPADSGIQYVVAKWVSGDGAFNLQSTGNPLHDVSVASVASHPHMVYQGDLVNVTVETKNEGGAPESFNVTAKFENATFGIFGTIGTEEVTDLAPGANVTLTFRWNTTNVRAHVNYTIMAEADVLEGEIEVEDNLAVDQTVEIRLAGDVNGDGIVSIMDLAAVAQAYLSREGDPDYDPVLDINHDDIIDIRDLSIIGRNYGATA